MKKILLIGFAALLSAGVCMAENNDGKKQKYVTTCFQTDIECHNCVKKIENNIPSLGKGIQDVKIDLPARQVTVTYDPAKNSDEKIVKGFASLRVKAEPVKAKQE